MDRHQLRRASELALLMIDGWRDSRGERQEIRLAAEWGKPIRFLGAAWSLAGSADTAPTTPHSRGFVPPESAALAEHFPQLEVLELLVHGGMGAVYKARQLGLDRLVALKILPPEVGSDPAFAERFGREARALAKLSHCCFPNQADYAMLETPRPDPQSPPRFRLRTEGKSCVASGKRREKDSEFGSVPMLCQPEVRATYTRLNS